MLWERSSVEMANGNGLPWQRSIVMESRSKAILSTGLSSALFKYTYIPAGVSCLFQLEDIR